MISDAQKQEQDNALRQALIDGENSGHAVDYDMDEIIASARKDVAQE